VATEKRERQRAGRASKREAEAKKTKRDKTIRRVAIVVVAAAIVAGSVALLSGGGSTPTTSTTSPTTPPSTTSTTAASSAADKAAQAKADEASVAAGCPASPSAPANTLTWASPPPMTIDTAKTYTAVVTTDLGPFTITLDPKKAPMTVNNFVFLANQDFYHCVIFHRVIPGFMDQTGDPQGTGTGGPGYSFADELPAAASPQYPIGSVAMANSGANTNGSQFFIVTGSQGEGLPPQYSLFGQVTAGMDIVMTINQQGTPEGVPPAVTHRILSTTVSSS
jgi:cyclophilin family peptidyl-prolyl cis-trans isomerase